MNCKNSLFSDTARAAQRKKVKIFFVAALHIWQTANIASGNTVVVTVFDVETQFIASLREMRCGIFPPRATDGVSANKKSLPDGVNFSGHHAPPAIS
jgi:hypothetical protein